MKKTAVFLVLAAFAATANASWWWPFGSDPDNEPPRISELVRPATELIDEAADLADEGKISEAVEKYQLALRELDRIEFENPERAQKVEFQTVYNKRAYVNSAIDSLLFKQARDNAKAVSVTDTTELQKRYEREKANAKLSDEERMRLAQKEAAEREAQKTAETVRETPPPREKKAETPAAAPQPAKASMSDAKSQSAKPKTPLQQAVADIKNKDYAAAELVIAGILAEKPNDAAALNVRAAMEMEKGEMKKAEKTLDQSIQSNPRSYYAYYNMARLILKTRGGEGRDAARRYYKTGRDIGGPADKKLEDELL